jgi:Calcineurin-like phosphoesterase
VSVWGSRFGIRGSGLPIVTERRREGGQEVRRITRNLVFALCVALATSSACRRSELEPGASRATTATVRTLSPPAGTLALPLKTGSVKFAVIGDSGRGDDAQFDVARQMAAWRARFPFAFVLMLGDNIYPPHTPQDYVRKFEDPYRALLDAGVTFHAAIGNHDDSAEVHYAPFNMGGRRFHTFRKAEPSLAPLAGKGARFFVLDSRSFDREQLEWLESELGSSGSAWKICYFHHPLYTSGRYQAGAVTLRRALEPVLIAGDVDVVLSGHEHFYERIHPQHGIAYFISGAGGALRVGDIRPSNLTAAGFDRDNHFMLMEISGDELYFQAISRTGETVDAGVIEKESGVRSHMALRRESVEPCRERRSPRPRRSGRED